jgi:hypothetical protein
MRGKLARTNKIPATIAVRTRKVAEHSVYPRFDVCTTAS